MLLHADDLDVKTFDVPRARRYHFTTVLERCCGFRKVVVWDRPRVICLVAMDVNAGRKKRTVFAFLCPLVFAILLILNCVDNPRLAGLRGPDVLRLIAVGMCVGVPLGFFAGRRPS